MGRLFPKTCQRTSCFEFTLNLVPKHVLHLVEVSVQDLTATCQTEIVCLSFHRLAEVRFSGPSSVLSAACFVQSFQGAIAS